MKSHVDAQYIVSKEGASKLDQLTKEHSSRGKQSTGGIRGQQENSSFQNRSESMSMPHQRAIKVQAKPDRVASLSTAAFRGHSV